MLCGKQREHLTLNSAMEQELHNQRVGNRANATSSAYQGSDLVKPSIQKLWTKFILKNLAVAIDSQAIGWTRGI